MTKDDLDHRLSLILLITLILWMYACRLYT